MFSTLFAYILYLWVAKTIVDEHKYLSLPEDAHCIWEDEAGVMNPRRLVAAQCKLFTQAGGVIIKSIVSRVEKQLDIIQLHTIDEAGAQSVITATKVICALGVYVNYVPGLLPTNSEIDVRVEPHTVVFFELTEKEAQRFRCALSFKLVGHETNPLQLHFVQLDASHHTPRTYSKRKFLCNPTVEVSKREEVLEAGLNGTTDAR
jgi:hypothetical protein